MENVPNKSILYSNFNILIDGKYLIFTRPGYYKLTRFSICHSPELWRNNCNEIIASTTGKQNLFIGDVDPSPNGIFIWIISGETSIGPETFASGTNIIFGNRWAPPDDVNESAFILCDDLFADRITLQGNTQFGYKQFSNITLKRE